MQTKYMSEDAIKKYHEETIRKHFKRTFNVSFNDSPQFLSTYIYLEFWDGNDIQHKIRFPYPTNYIDFISNSTVDMNYIYEHMLMSILGCK